LKCRPLGNTLGLEISFRTPRASSPTLWRTTAPPTGQVTIVAFTIDANTGALSEVPGSPFAARNWPLFVTARSFRQICLCGESPLPIMFRPTPINATTGALSEVAGSPFAAGSLPESIRIEPSGKFAYVAIPAPATSLRMPSTRAQGPCRRSRAVRLPRRGSPINLTIFRAPG
jgi:hypothetical protein